MFFLQNKFRRILSNKASAIRVACLVVLVCLFAYSICKIALTMADYRQSEKLYDELRANYGPSAADEVTQPSVNVTAVDAVPHQPVYDLLTQAVKSATEAEARLEAEAEAKLAAETEAAKRELETNVFQKSPELLKINRDLAGWIKVPGTNIDYPVVQTTDNDFYLHHDFKKRTSIAGSIFMDYRNDRLFGDRNTILYGHHMKNKSMFTDVVNFKDKAFFDEHKWIYTYTPDSVQKWEVALVFVTDTGFDYLKTDFSSEKTFQSFMKSVRKKAKHSSGVEVSAGDDILTLSTCSYEFDQARTVLIAKKVE